MWLPAASWIPESVTIKPWFSKFPSLLEGVIVATLTRNPLKTQK